MKLVFDLFLAYYILFINTVTLSGI